MLKRVALSAFLCFAVLPAFAENWSIGGAIGPFVFGRFADRTVVINTETGTGKTTSRLSAATRPGAAADIERDFNDWLAVRLETSWTQSKLRLKSSGGGTGVTIDSGRVNITTFVVPLVVRLNRGSVRFHVMGGPAYAIYNVHRRTGAGTLPLFQGTRDRWGGAGGAGVEWQWSRRFGIEGQITDIITGSPFRREDIAATNIGVHIPKPQNGHTTVGIRYRF